MEIFTLLEELEDLLEKSKGLPFTHKSLVDKEEILEIIKEIRRINRNCLRYFIKISS